ncbi:MAG TPA: hypothetical protein VMT35_09630 [Ignavibacteriaceae bacterium]|nr:hypothetical protein [Ignavibacteriaceae bacterium]
MAEVKNPYPLGFIGGEAGDEHVFAQLSLQFSFDERARSKFTVIPSLSVGYRF